MGSAGLLRAWGANLKLTIEFGFHCWRWIFSCYIVILSFNRRSNKWKLNVRQSFAQKIYIFYEFLIFTKKLGRVGLCQVFGIFIRVGPGSGFKYRVGLGFETVIFRRAGLDFQKNGCSHTSKWHLIWKIFEKFSS